MIKFLGFYLKIEINFNFIKLTQVKEFWPECYFKIRFTIVLVYCASGYGDYMSLELTEWLRDKNNIGGVDKCSDAYR